MTAPTPNAELAYKVLDHIDAHPATWDQRHWCGTAKCFAGWAAELSGERADEIGMVDGVHVAERAAQLLGFASTTAMDDYAIEQLAVEFDDDEEPSRKFDLFSACNSRADLGRLVAEIFGPRPHPAESSFAPGSTLKDSPDPMYPEGEPDHSPDACLMLLGGERCPRCVGIFGASDLRCTVCGSLKSQHNQLGLQLHGLIPAEEMQPPPCADHAASELACRVCTAQRRAFYAALGRDIGGES